MTVAAPSVIASGQLNIALLAANRWSFVIWRSLSVSSDLLVMSGLYGVDISPLRADSLLKNFQLSLV